MKTIPYQDLGGPDGLPEDERIAKIVAKCRTGAVVGVFLDDDPDIVARYRTKLAMAGCKISAEAKGPVKGVVTLQVTGRPS